MYGYFVEPSKSCVVVDESFASEAESMFSEYGVKVVRSQRLLGGVIGDEAGRLNYIQELVKAWKSNLESLALIAETQPQAAFSALTKSMQFQWSYVQRVVPGCQSLFDELESVIFEKFLPAMFGCEVSSLERELFSLPARMSGLGVFNQMRCPRCYLKARRSPPRLLSMRSKANKSLRLIPTLAECWRLRQMS